jgi:hypothetical protein
MPLGSQPFLLRGGRRFGSPPLFWFLRGFAKQPDQPLNGILPVSILGPIAARLYDHYPIGCHTAARDLL